MVDQLTYRDRGSVYLAQAYEELEKQDIRQATHFAAPLRHHGHSGLVSANGSVENGVLA